MKNDDVNKKDVGSGKERKMERQKHVSMHGRKEDHLQQELCQWYLPGQALFLPAKAVDKVYDCGVRAIQAIQ